MGKFLYGKCEEPLPDIYTVYTPEKQEQFLYAHIAKLSTDGYSYSLRISTEKQDVTSTGYSNLYTSSGESYVLREGIPEWESTTNVLLVAGIVEWANFDVLYNSAQGNLAGTLYLAASEPVPVLPKVSPQLAFTIGKQLGRRIFR